MEKQPASTLFDEMNKCNETGNHRYAVIVFTEDSFDKPYTVEERSYKSYSGQWGWDYKKSGRCRSGDCLDGKDDGVRLDWYDWTVEYWYWAD